MGSLSGDEDVAKRNGFADGEQEDPPAESSEEDEPLAKMAKPNGTNGQASVTGPRLAPGQGSRSLAGKGAGKGKGKQREPVSVVRKEGDDVIVDEDGSVIRKAGPSVGHAEDAAIAQRAMQTDDMTDGLGVSSKQVEAAADVVNRLTQGVTVDVEREMRATGLAEDIDVDEIADWGDLDVVSCPCTYLLY
jgi:hypothetical protein